MSKHLSQGQWLDTTQGVAFSPRTGRLMSAALIAAWLAGCAPMQPAPIENRESRQAPTAQPATEPPKEQPSAANAPADVSVVQTAPIRGGSLDVKPLTGGGAPGTAAQQSLNTTTVVRNSPKGVKRPYSESALAEMVRADAAAATALVQGAAAQKTAANAANLPAGAVVPTFNESGAAKKADAGKAEPAKPDANASKPDTKVAAIDPKPAANEAADKSLSGLMWPVKGKVIGKFEDGKQKGIAIAGNKGDKVVAAASGTVIFSGAMKGYGNIVVVKHDDEWLTVYAHNDENVVKEGQSVKRGDKIASLGSSDAERDQLHFEVRKQGKPVDPLRLLPAR